METARNAFFYSIETNEYSVWINKHSHFNRILCLGYSRYTIVLISILPIFLITTLHCLTSLSSLAASYHFQDQQFKD